MAVNYRNRNSKSVQTIESCRELKKLKLQEEFLEKNLSSTIKGLKIDADLIRQINEDRLKTSTQRKVKVQEIARDVLSVVQELNKLKCTIQEADASTIRTLDVGDCGSRLTRLSNKIEDSKKVGITALEKLTREEEALSSDLQEFERTIFTDRIAQPAQLKGNTLVRKCPTRSEVNDEFTELIARTGHTQGWTNEDHSLFLKIRKKSDSVPQLVIELKKKRPHLTNEEIVNHEAWQKLYTELSDKRKKDIADWRSRNRNKTETGSREESDSIILKKGRSPRKKVSRENTNKKKEEERDKEHNIVHCENNNKKKIIEEWKAERARKSAMDEEQKIRLEKAKIEEEKRRRETKRCEAMIKLSDYRKRRSKSSSMDDRIRSISQANFSSLRLIKSFREQDDKFVRKKLSRLRLQSEKKSYENKNELPKRFIIEDHRSREYSTLFKPTKVWEEKCKRDVTTEDLFGRVNYVKDIQRLSTPAGYETQAQRK